MNIDWNGVLAYTVILAAAIYLARRMWRAGTSSCATQCGGGCDCDSDDTPDYHPEQPAGTSSDSDGS